MYIKVDEALLRIVFWNQLQDPAKFPVKWNIHNKKYIIILTISEENAHILHNNNITDA